MASRAKVPATFWIVATLGLLWNAFGAVDYTMTQIENEAYLANFTAEERAYFTGFPAWQVALWAIGVWGSVVGSVLMLLRSRWAIAAFGASLFGLAVTTAVAAATDMPESLQGATYWGMTVLIWAILLGLLWYSRRALRRGYLR